MEFKRPSYGAIWLQRFSTAWLLVGTYSRCMDSLIQVSRAAEQFCFWPHLVHRQCIDYKSEAALMQQSSVVVEGSLESLADPFSLCSQRNAVSCDGCGTCVQSCRSVSPRHSVLCQEGGAIPLNHCQTGDFSHFESSKPAITIVSRNRLKAAVEENTTLRMAVIFERPRTGHFSVLFLFAWIPSTSDRCR